MSFLLLCNFKNHPEGRFDILKEIQSSRYVVWFDYHLSFNLVIKSNVKIWGDGKNKLKISKCSKYKV